LKKEILSDDFKKRKIFWKNIAENFVEISPYGKIFYGKFSTSHHYNLYRSSTFSTTDPILISLIANQGLRGEKPTTNRLSTGSQFSHSYKEHVTRIQLMLNVDLSRTLVDNDAVSNSAVI
jgi:hypothetical protein